MLAAFADVVSNKFQGSFYLACPDREIPNKSNGFLLKSLLNKSAVRTMYAANAKMINS
jgi:hypothetical protein